MNIGAKIKQLRCHMGFTQEELASSAKTTKQTIHKYETGIISNIPASKIKAIADKLNTTPSYLMGWESEKENEKQNRPSPDKIILTEGERLVLDLFNEVPEEQQPMVIEMIRAALKMRK